MSGATAAPSGSKMKCKGEQLERFCQGVGAAFAGWGSLQLCKQHMQSREKADRAVENMVEDIRDWFAKEAEIFPDELEHYLYGEIDEAMEASIEDGTVEEVSKYLNTMFRECVVSNYEKVEAALGMAQQAQQGKKMQAVQKQDDFASDNEVSADEGAPQLEKAKTSPLMGPMDVDMDGGNNAPAATLDSVLHEVARSVGAEGGVGATRVALLEAVHAAAARLLVEAGAPPVPPQPKKKKKKVGKNNVELGDDGWTTVK